MKKLSVFRQLQQNMSFLEKLRTKLKRNLKFVISNYFNRLCQLIWIFQK